MEKAQEASSDTDMIKSVCIGAISVLHEQWMLECRDIHHTVESASVQCGKFNFYIHPFTA